ncbi:hypothetical protein Hte_008258 [Hypoxylon texense]
MTNTARIRQSHKKSRNGCRECKRRHVKCDERQPSCGGCNATERRCSFLDFHPVYRSSSLAALPGSETANSTRSSTSPAGSSLYGGPTPAVDVGDKGIAGLQSDRPPTPCFDLRHLVLLHHLESEAAKMFSAKSGLFFDGADLCFEAIFNSAVSAPYLMHELLAFSALHLSTIQAIDADKTRYLQLAAELQTRALTLFNEAQPDVRIENCMALFVFSSMIGMHALFDAVASYTDFSIFLNNVVHYLRLHRGVSAITHQSWHILSRSEIRYITDSIMTADDLYRQRLGDMGNECDKLVDLIRTSTDKLGPGPYKACQEAVEALHWVFGIRRTISKLCPTHITLAWPVRLSAEFVELLEQRQPISLIILAHWAVLLHVDRDFWVFGNAGQHMIRALLTYLGSYWDEWLVLPRSVLDKV